MTKRTFYIIALGASLGIAVFLSPFASEAPDGLERVAEDLKFIDRAISGPLQGAAPMPDYAIPRVTGPAAGMAAGAVGALAAFAGAAGAGRLLGARRNRKE
ncbi:MAG: PDGLE domain-containing protein [Nitrospinae bacterium]|nr:PDGLE domain-containing protein [Nitrospinota bacterium]